MKLLNNQQESDGKGPGCGCLIVVAIAIMLGIATYSALELNADFPGAKTITTFRDEAKDMYQDVQKLDIPSAVDSFTGGTTESDQASDPAKRHLELKQLMLKLTNEQRQTAGAPPVKLGSNPAAQLHAEAALDGCYSGHWDEWGLKPNHRYTLTDGTGADGENVSGSSYCISQFENYAAITSMQQEVAETVQGWIDSPGHKRNLLNPAHTTLNVGIAHDRFNQVMVQQFASDYVSYLTRPQIDEHGLLRMTGTVSKATLTIGNAVNVQIAYDPPPKPLTRGQLSYTYALCNPTPAGYVTKPLPPGHFYTGSERRTQTSPHPCVDPYQTGRDKKPPSSPSDAHNFWVEAKSASAAAEPIISQSVRIIADQMLLSSDQFVVAADISPILNEHGPGIYTIRLWGKPNHMSEPEVLSEQSIFWMTDPPKNSPYVRR